MTDHTKKPLYINAYGHIMTRGPIVDDPMHKGITSQEEITVSSSVSYEMGARIVSCFNALAGVKDPQAFIDAARELAGQLRGLIEIGKRDLTNPKYDSYFSMEALTRFAQAEGPSEGRKRKAMNCVTCGQKVKLNQSDEGTCSYTGMERADALEEAAKVADQCDYDEGIADKIRSLQSPKGQRPNSERGK